VNLADRFHELYRADRYARYWENSNGRKGYAPARDANENPLPYTPEVVNAHIRAQQVIGIYPLLNDGHSVQYAAIDFDNCEFDDVLVLYAFIRNLVPCYIETSKSKGWHLSLFFEKPLEAKLVRAFLAYALQESGFEGRVEIFPKQSSLGGALDWGNLIRPPITSGLTEHGRCAFLDPDAGFLPAESQTKFLFSIERIPPATIEEILELEGVDIDKLDARTGAFWGSHRSAPVPTQQGNGRPKSYRAPTEGDFQGIIDNCDAVNAIVMQNDSLTHDQRLAILTLAIHTKNGQGFVHSIMSQNSNYDAGTTQGYIDQAIKAGYKPHSCKTMMERGLCSKSEYCPTPQPPLDADGKIIPEAEYFKQNPGATEYPPPPSPIRYAHGKIYWENPGKTWQLTGRDVKRNVMTFGKSGLTFIFSNPKFTRGAGWVGSLEVKKGDAFVAKDSIDFSKQRQREKFSSVITDEELVHLGELIENQFAKEKAERDNAKAGKIKSPALTERDRQDAMALMGDPHILKRVNDALEQMGVVGETGNRLMIYLGFTSRILEKPINIVMKGESSSGKSYTAQNVMKLIPPESVVFVTKLTPQALFHYGEYELQYKILYINEIQGSEQADYAIRSAQSEGDLVLSMPYKDPQTGEISTLEKRVKAPIQFFLTTTFTSIHAENETRNFSLFTDDSPEQTRRIGEIAIRKAMGENFGLEESLLRRFHNFQRMLKADWQVIIPYAREIFEAFPTYPVRLRRDREQFLELLKIITIAHQANREQKEEDGKKFLFSTLADYDLARQLTLQLWKSTIFSMPPKSEQLLGIIDAAGLGAANLSGEFTVNDVLTETGDMWSKPTVLKWLEPLVRGGYLTKRQGRRKNSNLYERTPKVRGKETFLPPIEELLPKYPCSPELFYTVIEQPLVAATDSVAAAIQDADEFNADDSDQEQQEQVLEPELFGDESIDDDPLPF